jgi:CHAT domain-containing protein
VALVPFELLPAQGRMVIERASVGYTPTAATLLRAPTGGAWRPPWAAQLRAFADPIFDTSGESSEALPQLRAADAEVREVASQLAGRSTLHVGDDDRKAYLFSLGFPPILHLATHALADSHAIEQSRLFFSPPDGKSGRADYLFLREAYDLPLQGVELAVLSACDTERGPSARAEGVQSFSRAFLAAGARTTVTTLWRVADGPTAEFMSGFYHHLQTGAPRDEALRRAKLRFLQSGRPLADPHFWAAFVLTGEGARPVSRAIPWSYVAAALAIAGVLCVVTVIVARQTSARARPSNAA